MDKNKQEKIDQNKQEKIVNLVQKEAEEKALKNVEEKESKHLIVLHLLFELDFYCLNNPMLDDFFNPNSLEMLDDKIEVLTALKNGKKQAEIPKFHDVLEYLNECDVCIKYGDEQCDKDEDELDEYLEAEKAREIESYFRKAMKNFKKDIKEIKNEKSKKKSKKKNKQDKTSKSLKKEKKEKKSKKLKKDKKGKKSKKNN